MLGELQCSCGMTKSKHSHSFIKNLFSTFWGRLALSCAVSASASLASRAYPRAGLAASQLLKVGRSKLIQILGLEYQGCSCVPMRFARVVRAGVLLTSMRVGS